MRKIFKRIMVLPAIAGSILLGVTTHNMLALSMSIILWIYALSQEVALVNQKMSKTNDIAKMHKLRFVKVCIVCLLVLFALCMQFFAYWVAKMEPNFLNFSFVSRDTDASVLLVVTFIASYLFYKLFKNVEKYKRRLFLGV